MTAFGRVEISALDDLADVLDLSTISCVFCIECRRYENKLVVFGSSDPSLTIDHAVLRYRVSRCSSPIGPKDSFRLCQNALHNGE